MATAGFEEGEENGGWAQTRDAAWPWRDGSRGVWVVESGGHRRSARASERVEHPGDGGRIRDRRAHRERASAADAHAKVGVGKVRFRRVRQSSRWLEA